jgi:hypothetical protein
MAIPHMAFGPGELKRKKYASLTIPVNVHIIPLLLIPFKAYHM